MEYLNKLFTVDYAYCNSKECQNLFLGATREAVEFHYKNSNFYRNLCDNENFKSKDIANFEDLERIPFIMVNAFKWHSLTSIPKEKIEYEFTSSGTSGQTSHIFWDRDSKERQSTMRNTIVKSMSLVSKNPVNYLMFSYSLNISGKKGAAYAQEQYSHFAPAKNKFFAIDADKNGNPYFEEEKTIEKLIEYSKDDVPLRCIGFPAFIHKTILKMKQKGINLTFHKDSLVITAGGWKTEEDKKITKEEFEEEIFEVLGIKSQRLRDIYGFVEHGVPYITCKNGHFHLPIYARVLIREPGTLKVVGYNKKGLLNFISPYNLAQPAVSILSTDYGILRKNCSCGIETDYFELLGRAGLKKHQGCAITASELLKT